jgi:predicted transcriptional regulator
MTKIATLYGTGMSISDIAANTGVTRGTVRGYIRSPEMQDAVEAVQDDMVEVLGESVNLVLKTLKEPIPADCDPKARTALMHEKTRLAAIIIDKLGSKIISQVTTGEVNKGHSAEDTKALKEKLKSLMGTKSENPAPKIEENDKIPIDS